ncbi:MAG: L,D-transpeptidase [Devosia sp.]
MNRRQFAFSLLSAVALPLVLASPAQASRYYDTDLDEWVDESDRPVRGRRGKAIPREIVPYETKFKVGTIIIETGERRLYLVLPDGMALRYGIGVGRDGFTWAGQHKLTRKAEWPGWTPPAEMRKRVPDLPAYMPGGPKNPLGARALYIGSTLYRIHGTSEPWTIGQAVSSGCIRLTNEDVIDLYDRVKVGTLVVVHQA